jgi:TolB-like protein/DNA-binding winged helix-turn-helix (wHTH) protein
MSEAKPKLLARDDLVLDGENFQVRQAGVVVTLTPRAFDVLHALMSHAGKVVEKQQLFDEVWKDTIVSDNALTKIIKELRHALNDDANAPRYIETVPRRGYRFIVADDDRNLQNLPLSQSPHTNPSKLTSARAVLVYLALGLLSSAVIAWFVFSRKTTDASQSQIRSIAVLPFKPLDANSRDESLELGVAETLITRLSNLKQLAVRPMGAVRKYTDLQQDPVTAGRELQADAVLDGSIQKVAERVRITARLINVQDGRTLWSQQFDENFTNIFAVQDSITERITDALTPQLSTHEKEQVAKHHTNNAEAYQLYLRAQLVWHGRRPNWIQESLNYYQQALEKDPNFALAYVGAADCYITMSGHRQITLQEAEEKARPNIMTALRLDENLAEAHNALAELKYQYEYDWNGAEIEFKRAIELNPNVSWIRQAYGWFLMVSGRFVEAAPQMEKARELDPSSMIVNVARGRLFYYSKQYDQAAKEFQNVIAVEPNDPSAYYALYSIYGQQQRYPEAVEAFLHCGRLRAASSSRPAPELAKLSEELREAFKTSGWKGFLLKRLEQLERSEHVNPRDIADLHALLGQKEEALKWLEKSFEMRSPAMLVLKIEPIYEPMRGEPRYAQLLRKVGLEP